MNPNDQIPNPVTEDDIANFLVNTPDFFERHSQVLSAVQLTSPHGNRAVSLQERQAEMLREKIKALESRIMEMVRNGNENLVTANRIQQWTRQLMLERDPQQLPQRITTSLCSTFMVPQAALRVWHLAPAYAQHSFAQGVSEDLPTFAASLAHPYCGAPSGFEAEAWLDKTQSAVASIAMIPLRNGDAASTFGLLVLASPDAQRFHSGMGTDFLEQMGGLASAALSHLQAA